MNLGRSWVLGALLSWATGCSVTALAEPERNIAVNSCETDRDCRAGVCDNRQCLARSSAFSTLLFEVKPVSLATGRAPTQLFAVASDVPQTNGAYVLHLSAPTALTAAVNASLALPVGCAPRFVGRDSSLALDVAGDESIPVRATFTAAERRWGVPTQSSTVFVAEPAIGKSAKTYAFSATLAAGNYDVYIEPYDPAPPTDGTPPAPSLRCIIPPLLLRGQPFQGGKVSFQPKLPAPARLELHVVFPETAGVLTDWTVDILEPVTGRVVSTRETLVRPSTGAGYHDYTVELDYFAVAGAAAEASGSELVRLSPPPGLIAPTLLFERKGLELFTPGSARIDQFAALPKPVQFEGRAVDEGGNPIQADITFVAKELTELSNLPAAFTRQVTTSPDGTFQLELLPGTYQVLGSPRTIVPYGERPFAVASGTWLVATTPPKQAGHDIAFSHMAALSGDVLVPNEDGPALGAAVSAESTGDTSSTKLYRDALGELSPAPKSVGSEVGADATFTIFAEPGRFNFFVRPPVSSGFPWFVAPGLDLSILRQGDQPLDRQTLPLPVRLSVQLELGGILNPQALSGAQVRVFALLSADGAPALNAEAAAEAVAIAQGSVSETGAADLMLPMTLKPLSVQ